MNDRELARDEVRMVLAELDGAKLNTQTLAKMLNRRWGTVANWRKTGRIERYDWERLMEIYREYVPNAITGAARNEGTPQQVRPLAASPKP